MLDGDGTEMGRKERRKEGREDGEEKEGRKERRKEGREGGRGREGRKGGSKEGRKGKRRKEGRKEGRKGGRKEGEVQIACGKLRCKGARQHAGRRGNRGNSLRKASLGGSETACWTDRKMWK